MTLCDGADAGVLAPADRAATTNLKGRRMLTGRCPVPTRSGDRAKIFKRPSVVMAWEGSLQRPISPNPYGGFRSDRERRRALNTRARWYATGGSQNRARPDTPREAHRILERWAAQRGPELPPWLVAWRQIRGPQIAALLTEESETAVRLRKPSPFAILLSESERKQIYADFCQTGSDVPDPQDPRQGCS